MAFNLKTSSLCFLFVQQVLSIKLEVNPKRIESGISKNLLVNCSVTKGSVPKLNGLTSLILSRTVNTDDNRTVTLASINAITGQTQVYIQSAVGHGTIDNKGDSYISLQWPYPMDDMAGNYICEANGMDIAWRPTTVIEKVTVTAANLNLYLLKDLFRNVLITLDDLKSAGQSISNEFKNLQSKVDIMQSRTEASKLWYFKRSEVYKGRRYYLSQQDPISRSEQSMATCVQYGGYLAEIEDWEEFYFIKAFINKSLIGFRLVLIGGTDEAEEEVWKYRHSNNSVPDYIIKSRKLGRTHNCLYLFDERDWLAIDDQCYYPFPQFPTRFLCEILE